VNPAGIGKGVDFMKYFICLLLTILLVSIGCVSYEEIRTQELVREGCAAHVVVPPDMAPAPQVLDTYVGANEGAVSGHLVGPFSQAVAETKLDVSDIRGGRETAGAYGYKPSDGVRIVIEDVFTQPDIGRPNDFLNLNARYALMTPTDHSWAEITELRELFYGSELVGRPEAHVALINGTYTTMVRIRLPADVPTGEYRLITTIKTPYAQDSKEIPFTISEGH
jgi:hypothetical protein